MIVIRTDASSATGIGHLARCRRLASGLRARGFDLLFVVDRDNGPLSRYLEEFSYRALYPEGERFNGEQEDAGRFVEVISPHRPEAVIVDDYRLSAIWERVTGRLDCPLIVLDDQNRAEHQCDLLVDAKWEGAEQTPLRYQGRIPEQCVRLLGPKYLLIDESFSDPASCRKRHTEASTVQILLSLGGGGDLSLLVALMKQMVAQQPEGVAFRIAPVVGPYATNRDQLLAFSDQHAVVEPVINQDGLFDPLCKTDLYIGAAGGTLFEALALQLPSLTFSLSENQQNNRADLEALGHYFHLNRVDAAQLSPMAELIWTMVDQLDRLRQLYDQPASMAVDGKGVERVADAVQALIDGCSPHHSAPAEAAGETPVKGYQFTSIDDRAMNRYLDARNLEYNLQNMTEQSRVDRLHHYLWWLRDNRRLSYLLQKGEEPLLYIWHQRFTVNQTDVLIGGWFVCSRSCSPLDAMYALDRQLTTTDQAFEGVPWVAVIHQQNRFVQQMNRRFGFVQIEPDHPLFPAAEACFPKANRDEFFYYAREVVDGSTESAS